MRRTYPGASGREPDADARPPAASSAGLALRNRLAREPHDSVGQALSAERRQAATGAEAGFAGAVS
ncbi:histidine kinase [Streptomyces flaveolus]|uniref:histidine kinase n=1 Tax=Streptomyces flaveolus TaxID=67297 RepID=UPI00382CDF4F